MNLGEQRTKYVLRPIFLSSPSIMKIEKLSNNYYPYYNY